MCLSYPFGNPINYLALPLRRIEAPQQVGTDRASEWFVKASDPYPQGKPVEPRPYPAVFALPAGFGSTVSVGAPVFLHAP